ncbi:MAG: UDP-4-amino-4,6-dideoxy-N-acetyl-beta-L-altrosamine transaminase [Magnetococcus sp. YQC-5]
MAQQPVIPEAPMTSLPYIPFGRQTIDADDVAAVVEALQSNWLTTGPRVKQFDQALALRVGAEYAACCSSGTAGLHLALMALGIGPSDAVVVPSVTFLATANAVRMVGARVIFTDVDPDTGLMRLEDLERVVAAPGAEQIKVVIPVHLNGQCMDLAPFKAVAERIGAVIVEDGCHALGAARITDAGIVPVGACQHSVMTVFSFHPTKNMTTGEGGAVTTNDPALYRALTRLRSHGLVYEAEDHLYPEESREADGAAKPWYYEMARLGFNYRLNDFQCALGLSQLAKLDKMVAARQRLAVHYDQALVDLAPVVRPVTRISGSWPAWHIYVILCDFDAIGLHRVRFMGRLREQGVGSQVHYMPLYRHPYYRPTRQWPPMPGAEAYYQRCLSIPMFPDLSDLDQERVITTVRDVVGQR